MKFDIQPNSHANITFNGTLRVSIKGDFQYLVKWFCDDDFIGEMFLNGGCWGSYNLEIGNWRIEFWDGDNLINHFNNNITNQHILISFNFSPNTPGKQPNIGGMVQKIKEIESKYNCKVICYFPNSETYTLPESIITYKMNDSYKFKTMVEEWII